MRRRPLARWCRGAAPFVALILLTAVAVAVFADLALFIPFG